MRNKRHTAKGNRHLGDINKPKRNIKQDPHQNRRRRTAGPEVIKLFSCSTQLSMKFFLLINIKMPTIVGILIAILCNHFTFHIGGSARVVSGFSQTFSVCMLSHKNMSLMVDSFCCVSVAMATASKYFFKKSGKKLLKISYF